MELTIDQTLQSAITAQNDGKYEKAEKLYQQVLQIQPTNLDANNNIAVLFHQQDKLKKAENFYHRALRIQPKHADANHNLGILKISLNNSKDSLPFLKTAIETNSNVEQFWITYINALILEKKFEEARACCVKALTTKIKTSRIVFKLGIILHELGKFDEALKAKKIAIVSNPNSAEAYHSLGITQHELTKYSDAEISYKKAVSCNKSYTEAYGNLGATLKELGRFNEAEESFRKAIELNPNSVDLHNTLNNMLRQNELLLNITQTRKLKKKNEVDNLGTCTSLDNNPLILHRKVESELINILYKINSRPLDALTKDPRHGNGRSSDFQLFEKDYPIIKVMAKDLIKIMKQAVKSDIYIMESFFNILSTESSLAPHGHITSFDKIHGLVNQKFSLVYYLSVGDQDCDEPGILKLYEPEEKILPSEGMIMIFPAEREHSVVYKGKIDRVMIGVNFYSVS